MFAHVPAPRFHVTTLSVNTCNTSFIADRCCRYKSFHYLLRLSNYYLDVESSGSTYEQRGLEQDNDYKTQLNPSQIK